MKILRHMSCSVIMSYALTAKLVLIFPGVKDGESGINVWFRDIFERTQEIVAERGGASLAWMQRYCNFPTYGRNRAEICSAFSDADWLVDVMDLQDIEEIGASDYRSGHIARDEMIARTTEMLIAVSRNTFIDMWVEYGGLTMMQANALFVTFGEALYHAQMEEKALQVYNLWVIVVTKK